LNFPRAATPSLSGFHKIYALPQKRPARNSISFNSAL
jgi:hypothetical protein